MRAKVIKANKSSFVLRSLRKEGMCQEKIDRLFSAIVLPNFTYALLVYGASDSDLTLNTKLFRPLCKEKIYVQTYKD